MARFILYHDQMAPIADASELLRALGARVIASKPGLALIETTEEVAEKLRASLPDWNVTPEVTAKPPTPRPKARPKNEQATGS